MEIVVYPWTDEMALQADEELLKNVEEWYRDGLISERDALLLLSEKTLWQLLL